MQQERRRPPLGGRVLLALTGLGVVLIAVGLLVGQQGVAVAGLLVLFAVAAWVGLAW